MTQKTFSIRTKEWTSCQLERCEAQVMVAADNGDILEVEVRTDPRDGEVQFYVAFRQEGKDTMEVAAIRGGEIEYPNTGEDCANRPDEQGGSPLATANELTAQRPCSCWHCRDHAGTRCSCPPCRCVGCPNSVCAGCGQGPVVSNQPAAHCAECFKAQSKPGAGPGCGD